MWVSFRVFKEGWTLQPLKANESIDLGSQVMKTIDLAQKNSYL